MRLTIVLPIYNEEACIRQTIKTIWTKVNKPDRTIDIIAVDDGSYDKTPQILRQLKETNKHLQIITHPKNLGYGAALRSGVKKATSDWIFFTDADMQFDVSEIEKLFPYMQNHDFIVGYRKNRADRLKRKIVSSVYNRVIRIIFGLKLRDVDCAFKLMRRSAVIDLNTYSQSFFISVELMVKAYKKNYRITEIGVKHFPRKLGKSTVSFKQIVHAIKDVVKLYRSLI